MIGYKLCDSLHYLKSIQLSFDRHIAHSDVEFSSEAVEFTNHRSMSIINHVSLIYKSVIQRWTNFHRCCSTTNLPPRHRYCRRYRLHACSLPSHISRPDLSSSFTAVYTAAMLLYLEAASYRWVSDHGMLRQLQSAPRVCMH